MAGQKEVEVNGKKFTIRELLAVEVDDINFDDKKEAVKRQVTLSTGLSEEAYAQLTLKERLTIVRAVNEVNGLADFQEKPKNA